MAFDTPKNYRNLVIYEVYVRNHGPNGAFADVEADLPRLASMGVDIVWLFGGQRGGAQALKGFCRLGATL